MVEKVVIEAEAVNRQDLLLLLGELPAGIQGELRALRCNRSERRGSADASGIGFDCFGHSFGNSGGTHGARKMPKDPICSMTR